MILSKHTKYQLRYAVEACLSNEDYKVIYHSLSQQRRQQMMDFLKSDIPESYGVMFEKNCVRFANCSQIMFSSVIGGQEFNAMWYDELAEDSEE